MKSTGIHWCDDTVNPTSGCDGCELWIPGKGGPCYAGNFHENRLAKALPKLYDPEFHNVRTIQGRMAAALRCMDLTGTNRTSKPWLNGLRRKVFVGDLGDIFSAKISNEFLKAEIIDIAMSKDGKRHDLLLLTKQPERAANFAEWLAADGICWPDNIWIGTSITSKASLPRIEHLAKIPAKHKFLSMEPLLSDPGLTDSHVIGKVDWIIIGGESGQGDRTARPYDLNWARNTINLGMNTNIAVFHKQFGSRPVDNGTPIVLNDHHGGEWDEWPDELKVRQMPFTCL